MTSLLELVNKKTKSQVFDDFINNIKSTGIDVTAWQSGEPIRVVFSIVSDYVADMWNDFAVPAIRAGFLDYAEGVWLTIKAWTDYGVLRRDDTFGTGEIRIKNTSGVPYLISPGTITIRNSSTNKTHTNINGAPLSAFGSLDLTFRSDEAGEESSTLVSDIAVTPTQAPAGVIVDTAYSGNTNIIGSSAESDDQLRDRARLSSAVSPIYYEDGTKKEYSFGGPRSAYEFIALSSFNAAGNPIGINRVKVVDLGNCTTQVYLATPSGPATGNMLTQGSDVQVVHTNMLQKIHNSGTLSTYPSSSKTFELTIDLTIRKDSGIEKAEAEDIVSLAVQDLFKQIPIGGNHLTTPSDDLTVGVVTQSSIEAVAGNAVEGIRGRKTDLVKVSVDNDADPDWSLGGVTLVSATAVPVLTSITVTATLV